MLFGEEMNRAFGPWFLFGAVTQGDALGWDDGALLALD
jgi:hypothetical protein